MDDGSGLGIEARGAPPAPVWQRVLAQACTRPDELLAALELDAAMPALAASQRRDFPLRVPPGFIARMRKRDPQDPLFLQVWPQATEAIERAGFAHDAVGDLERLKGGGLIHKYHGRALLVTTGACAVHCRYCFRRHFPYADANAARGSWHEALRALAADDSIEEAILSGGDPLSLTDDKLAALVRGLDAIPHLRRLRIHTRLPVVLPERVDAALLRWLSGTRLQKVIVLHVNHGNEIDEAVTAACAHLKNAGAVLLNQSVLLRGVNDEADVLAELSEKLFAAGVMPYYLHALDRVEGAGHFEVDDDEAAMLMRRLAARLPGFLVPRLVREAAGADAKRWLPW